MGRVLLRVIPWGLVSVNQRPVGTTPPLTQLDLPEGLHRIEVSNPAAPPVIRSVQVKKGEPVTLFVGKVNLCRLAGHFQCLASRSHRLAMTWIRGSVALPSRRSSPTFLPSSAASPP